MFLKPSALSGCPIVVLARKQLWKKEVKVSRRFFQTNPKLWMVVVAGHIREHPWLMTWQRCRWSSWNLLLHVNFIISRMVQVDETTDRARRFQPVLVPLPVERWLPHVMVTSLELANRAGLVIPKDDFPFRWATLFFGAFPNPTTYFNQLAKHLIVVSFSSYPTRSSTI